MDTKNTWWHSLIIYSWMNQVLWGYSLWMDAAGDRKEDIVLPHPLHHEDSVCSTPCRYLIQTFSIVYLPFIWWRSEIWELNLIVSRVLFHISLTASHRRPIQLGMKYSLESWNCHLWMMNIKRNVKYTDGEGRRRACCLFSIRYSWQIAIYTTKERLKHNYVMMKGTRITNVSRMEQQMNINGKFSFIKFILKLYTCKYSLKAPSSSARMMEKTQLYFHLIHCLFLYQIYMYIYP